jgi:hypothetical protein
MVAPPQTARPDPAADRWALRHGLPARVAAPDVRFSHAIHALNGVRQLLSLTQTLDAAGLRHVHLKGPAFAQWLYGDPGARRFNDLDILVAPRDIEAALACLEQQGYRRRIPRAPGNVIYASIGAWPLSAADRVPVDLHWQVAGRRFSRTVTALEVLDGSRELSIGGHLVRVPSPEHTTVLHLSHSAKHLWYALEPIQSTAALLRRDDIDWPAVRDTMRRAGAIRSAATGLRLAAEMFDAPVPAPFAADIALPDVDELVRCARTSLELPPGVFPDRRLDRRMQRLSFDRRIDRVIYDLRRVAEPTQAEWEWLSLPDTLALGYWPVRLIRLAAMAVGLSDGRPRRESER